MYDAKLCFCWFLVVQRTLYMMLNDVSIGFWLFTETRFTMLNDVSIDFWLFRET
jgi:hypothetical protein